MNPIKLFTESDFLTKGMSSQLWRDFGPSIVFSMYKKSMIDFCLKNETNS